MSDTSVSSTLDALRARAKQLLALARNGDTVVITQLRESLPRLATVDDAIFISNVVLADVQHALARQRGLRSWAELKRLVEATDPVLLQTQQFFQAIRSHDARRARQILADTPAIARFSIHAAAAACDPVALQIFLDEDPTLALAPTITPDQGDVIMCACATPLVGLSQEFMAGSARCVELLLPLGADPNSSVPYGDKGDRLAVLYFASNNNNVEVVRMLLAAGANPNDGESIYHSAERNYREVMQLLVNAGVDISGRSSGYNNTALYFLAGHKPTSTLCASSELGMMWLMDHGADPNVASYISPKYQSWPSSGETPLHRVAEFGKGVSIARAIVEHGANVNAERRDGRTPYALAVRAGNRAVAEYLATVGANTEALSEIDRLLGACVVADSALASQIVTQYPDIISRLTANDRRTLAQAAEEGRVDSVRLMVSLGWKLSDEVEWGGTPLHIAAWFGRPEVVRLLVEMGAPLNVRDHQFGSSPIAWAGHGSVNARPGHDNDYIAVIGVLLDAGAQRAPSYNKSNEPPESLASSAVARYFKERGFAA